MKILLTESYRCTPAFKEKLRALGDVREIDYAPALLARLLPEVDVLFTGLRHSIGAELLNRSKQLKVIVTPATGLNHIDTTTCERNGVAVLSLRGEVDFLNTISATAELTWGLLLALIRQIPTAFEHVKQGPWNRDQFFGMELQGKTVGILGYGRIGKKVAQYARAFQMQVLAFDRQMDTSQPVQFVPLDELLQKSDVLTVHLPLNPETEGFLTAKRIELMKPGALLINTARGEIIDEKAALAALEGGRLRGIACDVLQNEFAAPNHPFIEYAKSHSNLLLTPHIGGVTYESVEKTNLFMVDKLKEYLSKLEEG